MFGHHHRTLSSSREFTESVKVQNVEGISKTANEVFIRIQALPQDTLKNVYKKCAALTGLARILKIHETQYDKNSLAAFEAFFSKISQTKREIQSGLMVAGEHLGLLVGKGKLLKMLPVEIYAVKDNACWLPSPSYETELGNCLHFRIFHDDNLLADFNLERTVGGLSLKFLKDKQMRNEVVKDSITRLTLNSVRIYSHDVIKEEAILQHVFQLSFEIMLANHINAITIECSNAYQLLAAKWGFESALNYELSSLSEEDKQKQIQAYQEKIQFSERLLREDTGSIRFKVEATELEQTKFSVYPKKTSWVDYIEKNFPLDVEKARLPAIGGIEMQFSPSPEIFNEKTADLSRINDLDYLAQLGETVALTNQASYTPTTKFLFIDNKAQPQCDRVSSTPRLG